MTVAASKVSIFFLHLFLEPQLPESDGEKGQVTSVL